MSVLLSKRQEAKTQFIETAIQLESYTVRLLSRLSVRYQRIFNERIASLVLDIVRNCEIGNSIYPSTEDDIKARKRHFMEAYGEVKALDVLLSLVIDTLLLNPQGAFSDDSGKPYNNEKAKSKLAKSQEVLGILIDEECRLLKGILDSDKERLNK